MKIYNEIVFDVDGKVIYEDSYEYSGDMMLCRRIDVGDIGDQARAFAGSDEFTYQEEQAYLAAMGQAALNNKDWTEEMGMDAIKEFQVKMQTQALSEQSQASDVQAGALPSLPSISNIGSVAPTGVINWNAIPGGFQPLPQTAGGEKKLYQLSQFHGGINQRSSPRDIADFECQEASNVTFSSVGRIKLLGDIENTDNSITTHAVGVAGRFAAGYGLFQFASPAAVDATAGEYNIMLTQDGGVIDAWDNKDGASDSFITLAVSNDEVASVYYAAGNGAYVADANFGNANAGKANIYVYRKDYNSSGSAANLITSEWVEGKILIDSPTFEAATGGGAAATDGRVALEFDDGSVSFAVTTVAGAATVHVGSSGTGTWNGDYFFYISWIFDGGVETGLTALQSSGGSTFANETLSFNFSVEDNNSSRNHIGGNSRIDGARIYFKKSGTAERFLLAEASLIDGVKGALDSTFVPWHEGATDTFDLEDNMLFENPPEIYSYLSINGYESTEVYTESPDELADEATGPTAIDVRYKTVVVGQAGTVFIGNVKFNGKHMPDSMMFSMPGRPGVFPKLNVFDSPSSDGSPITALAAFQDKILQFKQSGLYVINVSNPAQFYAQASFRDCGVSNPCQVFTTSFGVIFANRIGCFIYDGTKVISLTNGKFDQSDWDLPSDESPSPGDDAAGVPCVGYDPRSQNILVLKDIGADSTDDDMWVYNLTTQSWTEGIDISTNQAAGKHSNFIITANNSTAAGAGGYLSILSTSGSATSVTNYNHDKLVDTGAQTITYQTKDLDFGLPSQTKKLFKVYITYKGTPPSTINYRIDGTSTAYGFTETNWAAAGVDDYEVATLVPDTASEGKGWKSISIYMNGSATSTFVINDISILYRVRPLK